METESQKVIISNDMAKLKDQNDLIKRAVTMMEQDVSRCILLSESKQDFSYVVKSNALKRKCDEKQNLELLEEQYSALAEKRKL